MLVNIQNKIISTELIYSITDILEQRKSLNDYNGYVFIINFIGGTSVDIFWDERFVAPQLEKYEVEMRMSGAREGETYAKSYGRFLEKKKELFKIGKEALEKSRTELINLWQGSTSPIKIIETE